MRFQEPTDRPAWWWPIIVRCPRCGRRAEIDGDDERPIRLLCAKCSLVREWDGRSRLVVTDAGEVLRLTWGKATGSWLDPRTGRLWWGPKEPPPGRDEFFGAELWLQTTCCGGRLLWARNREHLEYLATYVAAGLREAPVGTTRKPLSWKLPTWMKQAKHRREVLEKIERLRKTLDE